MRPAPIPEATRRAGRNDLVIIAIIAFLVVSAGIAIGIRIDYILREMTTLSIMGSDTIKQIESERLAFDCSYDLRNSLLGTTVLEFGIRDYDRADEPEIRSIIREEFDKVRPYLGRVDIRIIFEPDRPEDDAT
jgi:hypothetical protein